MLLPSAISDPIDAIVDQDEARLLQQGYSDTFQKSYTRIAQVFRALSSVFTRGIQSPALRLSMLAYIADTVPGDIYVQKKEDFRTMAQRTLGKNLLTPMNIQVADLFAAYLLCYRLSWNSPGAIRHYEGCISLHNYLSQKFAVAAESSELFKVYGGFVLDELMVWLNTERSVQCQPSQPIHIELPSFDDLLDHFTPFSSRHIPTIHCASLYILQYCMDLLWLSIQHVVNRRIRSAAGKDLVSEARLRAVKGQFYTHKLQHYVAEVGTTSEQALRNKTVNNFHEQLGIACSTLCVHIGIRILDDRDILSALQSDEVHGYICRLTTYLKALGSCNHRLDILCVFLAGLGLREGSSSPCKSTPQ